MKRIIITLISMAFICMLFSNDMISHQLITVSHPVRSAEQAKTELSFFEEWDAVIKYREVELNQEVILNKRNLEQSRLVLNLFDQEEYMTKIDRVNVNVNQTISIRSRFDQYQYAYSVISTSDGKSLISIDIPEKNKYYIVTSDPKTGKHYLLDVDIKKMGFLESKDMPLSSEMERNLIQGARQQTTERDNEPATIDVMIVYTQLSVDYANLNFGNINNVISQAMEKGQLVMDNSLTQMTMNLVYSALVSYTESGSSGTDLNRITNPSDGYMDEVHAWRDTFGADLVSFITKVDDTGGLGWQLTNTSGNASIAFCISRVQQTSWTYTLIHEQGHNMGTHHHKQQYTQPGPGMFNYSAGWRWTGTDNGQYCSVMSYEGSGDFADGIAHSRVAYFSNPSIIHQGVATGDAVNGDNARSLREIKHIIAAYKTPQLGYPTNLSASIVIGTIVLNWTAPVTRNDQRVLQGYKVYRNNAYYASASSNTYTDANVIGPNSYSYYVTAQYSEGESSASNTVSVTMEGLIPPNNLTANVDNTTVTLNWEAPFIADIWFSHVQDEEFYSAVGTGDAEQFIAIQRFTPTQLSNLGVAGADLTKVKFYTFENSSVYTIKVWTGGTWSPRNPGSLVVEQYVGTVTDDQWTEVTLNTPVSIPTDQEIWIGYYVDAPNGYPLAYDSGPVLEGYGNVLYAWGSWRTLTEWASTLNYNWLIKAYAQTPTREISLDNISVSTKSDSDLNIEKEPISPQSWDFPEIKVKEISSPSHRSFDRTDRALLGYKVYRGQTLLTSNPISALTYTDTNVPYGEYTYTVKSVYTTGVSQGVSTTVNIVNSSLQSIPLSVGWNIMSSRFLPASPNIQTVFTPLMPNNNLVKVQNESGNSLEYISYLSQWYNSIGNISLNEGYRVKVNFNSNLDLTGTLVTLPLTIPLNNSWNLVSYPYSSAVSASSILANLVNNSQLVKVLDESGNAFEYVTGAGWVNNIGTFKPGEGYAIKVNTNTNLVYGSRGSDAEIVTKSFRSSENTAYFHKAWSGNGWQHFNLYLINDGVLSALLDQGDEVALYDGDLCVGAVVYEDQSEILNIKASLDDPTTEIIDGYTSGHPLQLKVWKDNTHTEISFSEIDLIEGRLNYEIGGSTVIKIKENSLSIDTPETMKNEITSVYPNPFNPTTNIKFTLNKAGFVHLDVYNVKGQRVSSLVSEVNTAGVHLITFKGLNDHQEALSSGIYYLRLSGNDFRSVKKIMLLK